MPRTKCQPTTSVGPGEKTRGAAGGRPMEAPGCMSYCSEEGRKRRFLVLPSTPLHEPHAMDLNRDGHLPALEGLNESPRPTLDVVFEVKTPETLPEVVVGV